LRTVAFLVLAAGALGLFAGALLARRPSRRIEGVATESAAHGAALLAFAFTIESTAWAAAVCAVWGLVLGARAVLPWTGSRSRVVLAACAGGLEVLAWWLLLGDRGVTLIEAYTLPLAAVGLAWGAWALRSRPELRSWVAYGPALLAGFLPSLAPTIATVGSPTRRLLLFVAALAVVVVGAVRRRQAPFVIGGAVLVIVALHELVLLWQRLPGWVPLSMGGLILLFLAITYERRRRDLARLGAAVRQMT
jgi:hypothetical protein